MLRRRFRLVGIIADFLESSFQTFCADFRRFALIGFIGFGKQTLLAAAAAGGFLLLLLMFLIGKRSGKKKTTLVEIRRV